jgi:trk system potassium uptake protein TrkH
MQTNEAMALSALIFVFGSMILTFPIMGSGVGFMDALFESVSASTTTGLSVLGTLEDKPKTFLFARAWTQWYGGLGIVVLALAIMPGPGRITKELAVSEDYEEDLIGGARGHAKRVLLIYVILTLVSATLLLSLGCGFGPSVLITLSAVSTGGFSPYEMSLANFSGWAIPAAVTLICLAASISFVFYRGLTVRRRETVKTDIQTKWLIVMCLVASFLVTITMILYDGFSIEAALRHGVFTAFSAQTTSGFSTLGIESLSDPTKLFIIVSMAVGGGIGSTAGGIKVIRILILFKLCSHMISRASMPAHAVSSVTLGRRNLDPEEVNGAALVTFLFLITTIVSWSAFILMGYDPYDSLFEVVSAMGTVGLSAGIVGPELPALLKGVLCIDMLMGRLEILALLVVFYPGAWIGRRRRIQ